MEIKMKVTSIFLTFALMCGMFSLDVFAGGLVPKANPFLEGRAKIIKKQVVSAFAKSCADDKEIMYEAKGDSKYDHRKVTVYNIPFLVFEKGEIDGSILHRYGQMLISARESLMEAKINSIMKNKELSSEFKEKLEEKLKDKRYCEQLADDLGINVDEMKESLFHMTDPTNPESIFFSNNRLLEVLEKRKEINPLDAGVIICTEVLSYVGKLKDRRTKEEHNNVDYALRMLFKRMTSSNCLWRNKNLLVVAIDERKFCSWLPWNWNREDHGAWVGFTRVKDLKHAPVVRCESDLDKQMCKLSQIYKALQLEDGKINLNLLLLCLKGEKSLSEVIQGSPTQSTLLRVYKEPQTEEDEL